MSRRSYTDQIAGEICRRIADGESLVEICKGSDMPSRSAVMDWLTIHEAFADKYAHARELQADYYADDIVRIADEAKDAQLARLQVDARKWKASKLAPKKYGDKLQTEHSGPEGGPIQTQAVAWQVVDPQTPGS